MTLSFGLIARWSGGEVLCVRFRRLFDLSNNKSTSDVEIERLGWGEVRALGVGGGV